MTQGMKSADCWRLARVATTIAVVAIAGGRLLSPGVALAQTAQARPPRVTIPYLANATEPASLDFMAAQCDLTSNGQQMDCHFRQVFVTPTSNEPTSCAITSNGYEQSFRRETDTRWVSTASRQVAAASWRPLRSTTVAAPAGR